MDPLVWGTWAQWASAAGSTAAFGATFYVIRRDAKVRRHAQARKVAFYVARVHRPGADIAGGETPRAYHYTVENFSDEPIYMAHMYVTKYGKRNHPIAMIDMLLPGQKDHYESTTAALTTALTVDITFRDNSGRWWDRRYTGQLRQTSKLRRWLEINFEYGFTRSGSRRQRFVHGWKNIQHRRRRKVPR